MHRFFILAFLCFSRTLFAQEVGFEIGPEMGLPFGLDFWSQLHSDSTGHYVLFIEGGKSVSSRNSTTPTLQKFDRSFKQLYSKPLATSEQGQHFGNMFYAGGKFLLCNENLDKKHKDLTSTVALIDLDGRILKTQQVGQVHYKKSSFGPIDESWLLSADTSKLLMAVLAHDDNDHLRVKVSLNVHTPQLEKIWSQEVALPFTKEQLTKRSWLVGNDGQVYLLSKVYEDVKPFEWKMKNGARYPAYEWVVFRFSAGQTRPEEFRLNLPGKFVTDQAIQVDAKNNLNCAGFYADDNKRVVKGVFFTRFNGVTKAVEASTRKELSPTDLAGFDTQKDKNGERGLDSKFDFNHFILRKDGGLVVIAEEAYSKFRHTPGMNGMPGTSVTYYFNNEIFVVSIGADGQIEWVRLVPKNQYYLNTDEFNGYTLMVSDSSLYFLYNDNKLNIDKPFGTYVTRMDNLNDAASALVTVRYDGQMLRQKMLNSKDDADALMLPANGRQIGPNEIFFVTKRPRFLRSSKFRLGVVRVE